MKNRYPSYQELQEYERKARQLRAAEMARIGRAIGKAVSNFIAAKPAKGLKHA